MNITVYSASSGQVPTIYVEAAQELGRLMAEGKHTLINGAGRTGLMGACADACLAAGGKAIGIIPQFMIDQHWQHTGMSQLIVTPNMHRRKELMAEKGDACIALPGGVGTLEELLELRPFGTNLYANLLQCNALIARMSTFAHLHILTFAHFPCTPP